MEGADSVPPCVRVLIDHTATRHPTNPSVAVVRSCKLLEVTDVHMPISFSGWLITLRLVLRILKFLRIHISTLELLCHATVATNLQFDFSHSRSMASSTFNLFAYLYNIVYSSIIHRMIMQPLRKAYPELCSKSSTIAGALHMPTDRPSTHARWYGSAAESYVHRHHRPVN